MDIKVRLSAASLLHLGLGEGNDPKRHWPGPIGDAFAEARAFRSGAKVVSLDPASAAIVAGELLSTANLYDDRLQDRRRIYGEHRRHMREDRDSLYRDHDRVSLALFVSDSERPEVSH